jgi:hypothetical protein
VSGRCDRCGEPLGSGVLCDLCAMFFVGKIDGETERNRLRALNAQLLEALQDIEAVADAKGGHFDAEKALAWIWSTAVKAQSAARGKEPGNG